MTAEVISKMGKPGVLVHGINIRPGKPTILAVCDGKPMVGLPGNPISALVIARLFVKPLIEEMTGSTDREQACIITANLSDNLPSQAGKDEYIPAVIDQQEAKRFVKPIFFKSNLIFALVGANGLIHIPADVTGYSAGDEVEVIRI
jgi:molybdopterin molybdotransferase